MRIRRLALATATSIMLVSGTVLTASAATVNHSPLSKGRSPSTSAATQLTSWPSWVAHPASLSCPHGSTLIAPTRAWTDSLGVAHFTYRAVPGMETSLPPKGLTAGRATSAILTDMGILPRSAAGTTPDRHAIRLALTFAQHPRAAAFCRSRTTPDGFVQARQHAGSSPRNFSHVYYNNWAGYAVTETENGTGINSVAGSWTQGRDESPNFSSSAEATWVGLGGGPDNESTWGLIQVGTSMQTGLGYQSWYEYLDNNCQSGKCDAHYTSTGNVGPGDSIDAETWWDSSTEACFYLSDDGHPNADIPTTCLNPGITYDHTSAEWINEYPDTAYYDNPGTIYWSGQFFSDPFAFGGAYRSPFAGSYEAIIMTYTNKYTATSCGSNNGVLSYPADPGGDSSDGTSQIITCSVQGVDS